MHPILHLLALDVLSDFFGTIAHLGMHKCPQLRPYHYVHHQKTSTFHNHPVDLAVMMTAKLGVPLALLPVPSAALLWCFLFATMFTSMAHHDRRWGYWVSLCWCFRSGCGYLRATPGAPPRPESALGGELGGVGLVLGSKIVTWQRNRYYIRARRLTAEKLLQTCPSTNLYLTNL